MSSGSPKVVTGNAARHPSDRRRRSGGKRRARRFASRAVRDRRSGPTVAEPGSGARTAFGCALHWRRRVGNLGHGWPHLREVAWAAGATASIRARAAVPSKPSECTTKSPRDRNRAAAHRGGYRGVFRRGRPRKGRGRHRLVAARDLGGNRSDAFAAVRGATANDQVTECGHRRCRTGFFPPANTRQAADLESAPLATE